MVDWWLRVPLDEATKVDASFLVESFQVAPGARLLDMLCGGGRHAVAATLKPGEKFVLDTGYLAEGLFPSAQERAWYPDGNNFVLASRRYDAVDGQLHVAYTFIDEAERSTHVMSSRMQRGLYFITKFQASGLREVSSFSALTREPFELGLSRQLIVGTKAWISGTHRGSVEKVPDLFDQFRSADIKDFAVPGALDFDPLDRSFELTSEQFDLGRRDEGVVGST